MHQNLHTNPFLSSNTNPDIICFSHLRWNFVFQRPQHLLSRFANKSKVFFVEEPMLGNENKLNINNPQNNLIIITPELSSFENQSIQIRKLLDNYLVDNKIRNYILWYYTPMMLSISEHLNPKLIVYDCMDELSAFKNAPVELKESEKRLISISDLIFTGGVSLYEAKKNLHTSVYPFPSSIDKEHFEKARTIKDEPADQAVINHPKIGFTGVIDERFDIDLLRQTAEQNPDVNFVMIGPVVKIDPESLPRLKNIFYLGGKSYNELPSYMSGWDIAMMPFALNESTRFISPTKTPEYLAAGCPVISTAITDVVNTYGKENLVEIIHDANDFTNAIKKLLNTEKDTLIERADEYLSDQSWDRTWNHMRRLIDAKLTEKMESSAQKKKRRKIHV